MRIALLPLVIKGMYMKKNNFIKILFFLFIMVFAVSLGNGINAIESNNEENSEKNRSMEYFTNKDSNGLPLFGEGRYFDEWNDELQELIKKEKGELAGKVCLACLDGEFVMVKLSSARKVLIESSKCIHKPYGTDYKYETPTCKSYECNTCKTAANTIQNEYEVKCKGDYS